MLKEIQEALALREEVVFFSGKPLLVRELGMAADVVPEGAAKEDIFYHIMVACIFEAHQVEGSDPAKYECGLPALTPGDVPALKAGSRRALAPLVQAVRRVNGLIQEEEIKN